MSTRTSIKTELNVLQDYSPIVPTQFKKCDYLILGNFHPDYQQKVLKQLTKRPKLIALDTMNYWIDIANEKVQAINLHITAVLEIFARLTSY